MGNNVVSRRRGDGRAGVNQPFVVAAVIVGSLGVGSVASAELIYAVTQNSASLISFDSSNPMNILSGSAISGLASNETVVGIDFRPSTGELYAVGSFSNLYTLNLSNGVATQVGGGSFSPGLNGSSFGFDFNPAIDLARVTSEANQNLVLNPNTGASTAHTSLFYGAADANFGTDPNVVASAYSATQLYGIDTFLDILVTQDNNNGTLGTVGSLGIDINSKTAFDISLLSGTAYLTVEDTDLSTSELWTIDLTTGAASPVGMVDGGLIVTSMAVVIPGPGAFAMLGLAGVATRRRRRSA